MSRWGSNIKEICMDLYKSTNKNLIFVKTYCDDSINSIVSLVYKDLYFSSLIYAKGYLKGVIIVLVESRYYVLIDKKNCLSINAKAIRKEIKLNRIRERVLNPENKGPLLLQEQRQKEEYKELRQRQPNEQLNEEIQILKAHKLFDEFLQAGVSSKITEPMLPEEKKIATPKLPKKSEVDRYRFWLP